MYQQAFQQISRREGGKRELDQKKKKRSKRRRAKREIKLNYCFSEPADHIKHTLTRWDEHPKERFDIFPANSSSLPLGRPLFRGCYLFSREKFRSPFLLLEPFFRMLCKTNDDYFPTISSSSSSLYKCIGLMSASSIRIRRVARASRDAFVNSLTSLSSVLFIPLENRGSLLVDFWNERAFVILLFEQERRNGEKRPLLCKFPLNLP